MQINGSFTPLGEQLLSKLLAGASVQFTRVTAGSGHTALSSATELASPQQALALSAPYRKDTTVIFPVTLVADLAETTYSLTELGVYALDPDLGEILYQVYRLDAPTDIVPGTALTLRFYLMETLSQDLTVSLSLPPAGLLTEGDLEHRLGQLMQLTSRILHVAKTGSDDTGDGSAAKPYLTIQKAVDSLPKYLGANAEIAVHTGAYDEIPILYQFGGPGSLLLRGAEGETVSVKALYGQEIWCYWCIWNLTITGEHPNDCSSVLLNSCMHVEINDVTCVQPSSTTQVRYGSIFAAYCHFVSLRNTVISNKQIAVDSVGSTVYLNHTDTGANNVTAIRSGSAWGSFGGTVFKGGATIAGVESTAFSGQIF